MPDDTILLAMELSSRRLADVRRRVSDADVIALAPEELLAHAPRATAIAAWGDLSPALGPLVAAAGRLTWVHCLGGEAGDLAAAAARHPARPRVTWRKGLGATLTAEHALAALLALAGRVPLAIAHTTRGEWRRRARVQLPGGLAVAGCGPIGAAVARLGAGVGLEVTVLDRGVIPSLPPGVAVLGAGDRERLLRRSHNLVVALPASARGWLGPDAIRRLPEGALVVVLSPPGIADEEALGQALRAGALGGVAVLGPRQHDPPPALAEHPGAVVSPVDLGQWPAVLPPALGSFLRCRASLRARSALPQGVVALDPSSS